MSVNNLLDSGNPAESWKDLRLSKLTLDSELVLSPSAQNVMSLEVLTSVNFIGTQNLTISNLIATPPQSIAPIGITYVGDLINVDVDGFYLIDLKFNVFYSVYTTDNNFNVIFINSTDTIDIIQDTVYMNGDKSFSVGFSRLVKLTKDKDYKIKIVNDGPQVDPSGSGRSYLSIIKMV